MKLKILLVGNYAIDRQESMLRFADLMASGLANLGCQVRLIAPQPLVAKLNPTSHGMGKWLGYVDKYLLFPLQLRRALGWADLVHICDHSNAIYTQYLQSIPHLVTCHDLGAIRGALGEDTDCPATATGKILQQWILSGLQRSRLIACDSTHTRQDLARIAGGDLPKRTRLVLLGLNHSYGKLDAAECDRRLTEYQNAEYQNAEYQNAEYQNLDQNSAQNPTQNLDLTQPFLLHVGSSLARKNREGILRIFSKIKQSHSQHNWHGQMVFAGAPLAQAQLKLARELDLLDDVVQVIKPSNDLLEALYNKAFALIYPSKFEGFGWPVIEAQACGCPVICSDRASLPEVAGFGALLRDAEDEDGFAADILKLLDAQERESLIQKGFTNIQRFDPAIMLQQYIKLYEELSNGKIAS